MSSKGLRTIVSEYLGLLASAKAQADYEKDVPGVYVPDEFISRYCDDLFLPKARIFLGAFSEDEVRDLAVLYGMLHIASRRMKEAQPAGVAELQKLPEWRAVMAFAKQLQAKLGRIGG